MHRKQKLHFDPDISLHAGLAVTSKDFEDDSKLPNPQQGTKRYMAPEILKGSIDAKCIDSYVMADMYAFSLLMWELSRRCHWHSK